MCFRLILSSLAVTLALFTAPDAKADVSSWLAFGSGYGVQRNHDSARQGSTAALTYSLGVGSSPLSSVVVGGLVRGTTFTGFGGTDLGLAVRAATGGFARGDWGLALDVGAVARTWSSGYGEWPLQAVLTGGVPWGFQVAVATEQWSIAGHAPAQGFFAVVEIDLLRLTLMRQGATTERWWPNPAPAGGHQGATASGW